MASFATIDRWLRAVIRTEERSAGSVEKQAMELRALLQIEMQRGDELLEACIEGLEFLRLRGYDGGKLGAFMRDAITKHTPAP